MVRITKTLTSLNSLISLTSLIKKSQTFNITNY